MGRLVRRARPGRRGRGAPFAASASIATDATVGEAAASGLGGYSVIAADSLDGATELAKGCLGHGVTVDAYETVPM